MRMMRASRLTALLDIYVSLILTNINIIIIYYYIFLIREKKAQRDMKYIVVV